MSVYILWEYIKL